MVSQTTNEQPIKTIVEQLLLWHDKDIHKDEIIFEIIRYQKLDSINAETVFNAMVKLGLDSCKLGLNYFIDKFAMMRRYFTEAQIKQFQDNHKTPKRRRD